MPVLQGSSLVMKKNPGIFIIGASKAGTTFLHSCLVQHPTVCDNVIKEPFFFSRSPEPSLEKWYSNLFEECDKRGLMAVDASPTYSEVLFFEDIPRRIYKWNKDAKIIYLVREPIARIKSTWRQNWSTGHCYLDKYYGKKMSMKFESAIFEYPSLLDATKYWSNLKKFLDVFPKEQVKVIFFENLVLYPEETTKQVWKFSGLDPYATVNISAANRNSGSTKVSYNPWPSRLKMVFPERVIGLVPVVLKNFVSRITRATLAQQIPPPVLRADVEDRVKAILTPEIKCIYEYLEVKNDPWGFFSKERSFR